MRCGADGANQQDDVLYPHTGRSRRRLYGAARENSRNFRIPLRLVTAEVQYRVALYIATEDCRYPQVQDLCVCFYRATWPSTLTLSDMHAKSFSFGKRILLREDTQVLSAKIDLCCRPSTARPQVNDLLPLRQEKYLGEV